MLETILTIASVVLVCLILVMIAGSIIVSRCIKDCPIVPEEKQGRKRG